MRVGALFQVPEATTCMFLQVYSFLKCERCITHRNQAKKNNLVIFDYIACIYDDGWLNGNVIEVSDQNKDHRVKFVAKSLNNNFNWLQRDSICWVPVSHVLCTAILLDVQSAGTCGYCLSNSEFNEILNVFDEFVA